MEQWVSEGFAPTQPDAGVLSTDEWTRSEAGDLADAARQRRYETQHRSRARAAEIKGYAERAVRRARHTVTAHRDDRFEKMAQDIAKYTRERPMTALLIATGVGMMLGWLSAAGRDSRIEGRLS
jgi:ElaB/YqjD/DUF883 family membrane-anchored ribosome-binding protein